MVDAAYPFDVAATLRLAHAESGRFDVLGDDQLVRCVNPERESLTWFYGVDGDDGELVDYHELDDFEAAPIERSKALASIASPKVDVSLVDREELDERRERGEAVTDGGVEQDVDRTDRVEPFSGEPADTPEEDEIPPAKDRSINQIPDLSVDDRVRVETSGNYAPDRTLTVESIGSDKQSGGLLETRGEDPGLRTERLRNRVSPDHDRDTLLEGCRYCVPQPASWTARCLGGDC